MKMHAMRRFLIAALLGLTACSTASGSGGDSDGGDAGAQLACDHFRDVASDAGAGILTNDELRGKLQEVYNDAQVSSVPGIAEGARGMLAAITNDNTDAFGPATDQFGAACDSIGH